MSLVEPSVTTITRIRDGREIAALSRGAAGRRAPMSGSQSTRWEAIDAARGIAMFFVCVAHFGSGYFASIGEPARQTLTDRIGMVASPTFMLISGMMLGMLASARSPAR